MSNTVKNFQIPLNEKLDSSEPKRIITEQDENASLFLDINSGVEAQNEVAKFTQELDIGIEEFTDLIEEAQTAETQQEETLVNDKSLNSKNNTGSSDSYEGNLILLANIDRHSQTNTIANWYIESSYQDKNTLACLDANSDGNIDETEKQQFEEFIYDSWNSDVSSEKLLEKLYDFDFVKKLYNEDGSDLNDAQKAEIKQAILDRYIRDELDNSIIRGAFAGLIENNIYLNSVDKTHKISFPDYGVGCDTQAARKTKVDTMPMKELREASVVTGIRVEKLKTDFDEKNKEVTKAKTEKEKSENEYKDQLDLATQNDEAFAEVKDKVVENLKLISDLEENKTNTQNEIIAAKNEYSATLREIISFNDLIKDLKDMGAKQDPPREADVSELKAMLEDLNRQKQEIENKIISKEQELDSIETQLEQTQQEKNGLDLKVAQYAENSGNQELKDALNNFKKTETQLNSVIGQKDELYVQLSDNQDVLNAIEQRLVEKYQKIAQRSGLYNALARYDEKLGKEIADKATKMYPNSEGEGYCAAGVYNVLVATGVLSSEVLCQHANNFDKVMEYAFSYEEYTDFDINSMSDEELNAFIQSLPAGTIVNWGENSQNPHGHVGILDGEGHEISDHTNNLGGWYAQTFLPKESGLRIYIPTGGSTSF